MSEGVREGAPERGFGARILCAGVIFPSKIQCIKNFEGGGVQGGGSKAQFGDNFLMFMCFSGLESKRVGGKRH